MDILFLCCAYSENQASYFLSKSLRGYQYAAQNFQSSLIDGFLKDEDVKLNVLSVPSLSTFPKGCRIVKIKDTPFMVERRVVGYSFGFLNLPFFNCKHQSRIDAYIDKWYDKACGEKRIVVYAMLNQQMYYAVEAKKRHPDIKLCLVVPDLPMYMGCNKYYKMLGLQKRDIRKLYSMLNIFDCYVLLTKAMASSLNITNKPYIVIEGIYNFNDGTEYVEKFPQKTLLYAGGIVSRYGVFDLIEAFHRIEGNDYELILCGPCSEMDKLNIYLSSDSRIHYKGLIPTSEARMLQKKASLLVNPRHSTEEFTKYSFPSKTLEYMASGTPVLMSPLPSIPDDYKPCLFFFEDESIDGMKCEIESVLSLNVETLNNKGEQARDFILTVKNSKEQTKKIIEMLKWKI